MEIKERILVTREMVASFADVSGDTNPIHLDEEAAAHSIFGRPIAHGILLASFFSKVIALQYPGPGSIYMSQHLDFVAPCFVGDEIEVTVKLDEQHGKVYFLNTVITDTNNKALVTGTAKIFKK